MSNANEPLESNAATMASGESSGRRVTEEGLAALLLRLLGVYFLVFGIIGGVSAVIQIIIATNKFGMDVALIREWNYLARPVLELAVGLYLLLGGQWVFDKLLTPLVRSPREDEPVNSAD